MPSSSQNGQQPICFLGKCLIFAFVFILACEGVNGLYIRLVLSQTYLYRSEAQFEANKDSVHVLVLGDSHPMSAVDTRIIPDAFNASSTGENIIQTYYRLRYYLEEEQLDIQLVLLPIDVHSFSSFRMDRFNPSSYWCKYINALELGRDKQELPEYMQFCLLGYISFFNDLTNTIDLLKVRAGLLEGEDELARGFRVIKHNKIEKSKLYGDARNRANRHLLYVDPMDPEAQDYFSRILDLLEERDIPVVMVKYPVFKEYYKVAGDYLDIVGYYDQVQDLLDDRSVAHPILDYHNLFWGKKDYFSDADHLNEAGAIEFTNILKHDLEVMGYLP